MYSLTGLYTLSSSSLLAGMHRDQSSISIFYRSGIHPPHDEALTMMNLIASIAYYNPLMPENKEK
jgi:hypothetical protein